MKTCTKCGVVKDYLDFYKDKTKKDGFSGACKACIKAHPIFIRTGFPVPVRHIIN